MPLSFYSRLIGAALLALAASTPKANAQDEELRLFAEPFSFTDVADAADDGDPFDLNVHVAFRRTRTTGTIRREPGVAPGNGRSSQNLIDIGDFSHTRNELELGLDIGLYHDVMFFARLPLVLSDARDIGYAGSPSTADIDARLLTPAVPGQAEQPLFGLPFESPTRSGIDTVSAGFAFSVMNQHRRADLPTWTMLVEGRFGIGSLMEACDADMPCNGGVSTGTHAIRFESRLSKRFRFAELFSGIGYEFGWAGRAEEQFSPSGRLSGYQNRRPPMRGSFTAGAAFIPWEHRGSWQRFSVDVRARATYVSEGRDYSPLYDALGTSTNPYLSIPNLEGIPGGGTALRDTPFNGLTDVQDHGEFGGTIALELQAARYVRFRFGADLDYVTSHLITVTDACNPRVTPSSTSDSRIGLCNEGIINSHHRPAIDLPGNRFQQTGTFRTRLFIEATAQF